MVESSMDTVLFVNATIGFSENLFLVFYSDGKYYLFILRCLNFCFNLDCLPL